MTKFISFLAWLFISLLALKSGNMAVPCLYHCVTTRGWRAFPHFWCRGGTANSTERPDGSLLTAVQLHIAVSSCRHWYCQRDCGGQPSEVQHPLLSHLNMLVVTSKLEIFQLGLFTACQRLRRNPSKTGQRSSRGQCRFS